MQKRKIYYIGFYDISKSYSDRVSNLAAINKMNYIASSIIKNGYEVEIISPSWMGEQTKIKHEKKKTLKLEENLSVTFCPSWKTTSKFTRNLKIIFSLTWLLFFIIMKVKRNEPVLVYHVQWLSLPIRVAKLIKKFKLILEVEEVYQDVMIVNRFFTDWENKLLESADKYILSTELLIKKLNTDKPYVICYGVYNPITKISEEINDGKIHLVYAGIIDSHKRGAFNAINASKFLSEKYVLHILGFGEIDKLEGEIQKVNLSNKCKIIYDGLLNGNDYIKYMQSCHIGLSTQSMEGRYLESSFPSKVLSYLSLGLRVISSNIECVRVSKINNLMNYYFEDNPRSIAEAIQNVDFNEPNKSREKMIELDNQFIENIGELLEIK